VHRRKRGAVPHTVYLLMTAWDPQQKFGIGYWAVRNTLDTTHSFEGWPNASARCMPISACLCSQGQRGAVVLVLAQNALVGSSTTGHRYNKLSHTEANPPTI
jgi:hypothetical protein